MSTIIKYFVKKYVISTINDVLTQYKTQREKYRENMNIWIVRVEKILAQLKSVDAKIADGEITEDELMQTSNELTNLIKEW